jgi:hypothetical protein
MLLTPRLRKADVDECEALFGKGSVSHAVSSTFQHSLLRYTVRLDGVPIAMFGVAAESMLSGVGHPWMFGTPAIYKQRRALIKEGERYIADMLRLFPKLENIVDARNTKSIAWLRRLGFEILPAEPAGASGLPFHRFVMEV